MLIDFHTHAFPERIAGRAVSGLAHAHDCSWDQAASSKRSGEPIASPRRCSGIEFTA